jgi:glycosyltransferase involved in cell wall biosynthesis
MPNAALEALASGLPVIATDIRGCAAAVEDGVSGRIVPRTPRGDPMEAELGQAIADMLNGSAETRREMSQAARDRATAFSWQSTARQFLELIRSRL